MYRNCYILNKKYTIISILFHKSSNVTISVHIINNYNMIDINNIILTCVIFTH